MVVLLNRERLESALIDVPRAGRMPVGVPALRMGQRQPADESRQVAVLARPNDQMPMIRHDAVSEQPHRNSVERFVKHPFERFEIAVLLEQWQTLIGPIEGVINVAAVSSAK